MVCGVGEGEGVDCEIETCILPVSLDAKTLIYIYEHLNGPASLVIFTTLHGHIRCYVTRNFNIRYCVEYWIIGQFSDSGISGEGRIRRNVARIVHVCSTMIQHMTYIHVCIPLTLKEHCQ